MLARLLVAILLTAASSASAECYADYKAKQENGELQLHYGVIELPEPFCDDRRAARQTIAERIGRDGWQLLSVEGIFGADGLDRRRQNAGDFFLRY